MLTRNLCLNCKHFYITWDNDHPYGCKGFDTKSKQCPSFVVYNEAKRRRRQHTPCPIRDN